MAKRDSDTDIRKFMPDLASILKRADPAYEEKIYRDAMDNPELDEAIAERDRALAEMEARGGAAESAPANDPTPTPGVAAPRVSAPSPWAKGAVPDTIDRSALPSANAPKLEAPAAAPPVTSPVQPRQVAEARPSGRRALPRWVFPGMAAIALSPFAMWAIMSMQKPRDTTNPPASAAVSARATAPASVDAGPTPSVPSSALAPSAPPTTSADAPPVTSAPPAAVPPTKRHVELRPRGAPEAPIADAGVPEPIKTSVPIAPVPSPPASITPAAPPASSSPDPFLDKKPR